MKEKLKQERRILRSSLVKRNIYDELILEEDSSMMSSSDFPDDDFENSKQEGQQPIFNNLALSLKQLEEENNKK